ncbi:hypothetical protein JTB14_018906 [Gonioctena quinquepunctata]|nr:hypothetical protein JTB14_018906 [Gonioctena quinquepunctata]
MLSSGDKCNARHLHGYHHGLAYIESGREYEDAFIKFRNIDIAYVKGYKKKEFLDELLQELRCITTVINLEKKYGNGLQKPTTSRSQTETENAETGIPRVLANQPPRTVADYTSSDEDSDHSPDEFLENSQNIMTVAFNKATRQPA